MNSRRLSISSGKSSHESSKCGKLGLLLRMGGDLGIFIIDLSDTYTDDEFVIFEEEKFVVARPNIRIPCRELYGARFCVIGSSLYILCVCEQSMNRGHPLKVYSVDLSPTLLKPPLSEIILEKDVLKEEPARLSPKQFPAVVPYGKRVVLFSTLISFCDWDVEGVGRAIDFEVYNPTNGDSIELPLLCICCGTPERGHMSWQDQLLPPVYRLGEHVKFTPKHNPENWKCYRDFRITSFGLYEKELIVKTDFGTMFRLNIEEFPVYGGWKLCEDLEFIDDYAWNFVIPDGICVNPYGISSVIPRKWIDFPISSMPGFTLGPRSSVSVTLPEHYPRLTCSLIIAQLAAEYSGMEYDIGRCRLFWTLDILNVDLVKFRYDDDGDGQQHKRIKSFKDDESHETVRRIKTLKFCLNNRVVADCSWIVSMFCL
ncbi:uncharacterized protein LOC131015004 [Salvia miltiorrhiza]|uniref:uncharacterized protein LOC131015004 n=1 Tax=Salvia miltiorrhiza TaxID=226208 RepID=UPI0025AC73F8|nr:uncharacterized protein LOC131015004 [Salvia miltiorrhiza]XP_057799182.1 uncharacterized protein LOC131015004 [Salvia miltiorrhiza]